MNKDRIPYITEYMVPALALILTLFGIFFAIDAGYARSMHAGHGTFPPEFYSQIEGWIIGVAAGACIAGLNLGQVRRWAYAVWFIVLTMLGLALYSPLRIIKSGAARWIHLGPIVIQPAELAKLASILFLAAILSYCIQERNQFDRGEISQLSPKFFTAYLPGILVVTCLALVEREPDLGTAGVIGATSLVMLIAGGVRWKSIGVIAACLGIAAFGFVLSQPYRLTRLTNHGSQWSASKIDGPGFQQLQAKVSMAYGGLLGVGPGNGRAKHVIPAPTTDFVMTTVAEEFGFLGVVVVVGILGLLCWRLIILGQGVSSTFASLVLIGIAAWLAVQGCTNLLQANDTLPAIGIPFPFISSGGSSLSILWIAVGTVQAVLRPEMKKEEKQLTHDRIHRGRNGRAYLSRN